MNNNQNDIVNNFFKIAKAVTGLFIFLGFIFTLIIVKSMYPQIKAGGERQKQLNVLHEQELSIKYSGNVMAFNNIDGMQIKFIINNGKGFIAVDTTKFKHPEIFNDALKIPDKYLNGIEGFGTVYVTALNKNYLDKKIRSNLIKEKFNTEINVEKKSLQERLSESKNMLVAKPINEPPKVSNLAKSNNEIFYNYTRFYVIENIPQEINILQVCVSYEYSRLQPAYTYFVLK